MIKLFIIAGMLMAMSHHAKADDETMVDDIYGGGETEVSFLFTFFCFFQ